MEAQRPVQSGGPPLPRFEPASPETTQRLVSSRHSCQFYEDDDFLCTEVARYVADGLNAGRPVLVLATAERREAMERRIHELADSSAGARRSGQLIFCDAEETLASIMDGGEPEGERFQRIMRELFARVGPARAGRHPRIFEEMVELLWRAGNPSAALRLEELWNALAERADFDLLCGYAMRNFYGVAHSEDFRAVCAQHARAIPTEAFHSLSERSARDLEISLLQQRARALEAELGRRRELEATLRQALDDRTGVEQALVAARRQADEATRVKSDFLALMSHELRTPLNAILGYQDLLEHGVGGQLGAEQRAYLSRMRTCSHQLLRLIDQVLNLSHLEAGTIDLQQDVFNAFRIARETATMVEAGVQRRGLALDVRGPQADITLVTDAAAVRQVLLNLLTNAIKFTEDGFIRVSVSQRGEDAIFEVADTGIGIRTEDQDRIFEPFVQIGSVTNRRFGGSGLGLAVSRDLARLLGGDLTVRSELGAGSVFTLSVPIAKLAAA